MVQPPPRRQFIQQLLHCSVFILGAVITACQGPVKSPETETTDALPASCDDLSGLTEQELQVRETFGYVRESPLADNQCSNCNLWLPNEADPSCGKCLLFKGPVHAGGHCTSWAPQI